MIRLAKAQDLEQIMNITKLAVKHQHEVDKFIQWEDSYPNLDVFNDDLNKSELYVFELGDQVVGYFVINKQIYDAHYQANFTVDLTTSYAIHRVCSSPLVRGQNIGYKMLQYCVEHVKNIGGVDLIIDTNSKNIAMNKIIKQVGFEYVGDMELKPDFPVWYCYEFKY